MREKYKSVISGPIAITAAVSMLISALLAVIMYAGDFGEGLANTFERVIDIDDDVIQVLLVLFSSIPLALAATGIFIAGNCAKANRAGGFGIIKAGIISYMTVILIPLLIIVINLVDIGYNAALEQANVYVAVMIFIAIYYIRLLFAVSSFETGIKGNGIKGKGSIFLIVINCLMAIGCIVMLVAALSTRANGSTERTLKTLLSFMLLAQSCTYFCIMLMALKMEGIPEASESFSRFESYMRPEYTPAPMAKAPVPGVKTTMKAPADSGEVVCICGYINIKGSAFCAKCGKSLQKPEGEYQQNKQENKEGVNLLHENN